MMFSAARPRRVRSLIGVLVVTGGLMAQAATAHAADVVVTERARAHFNAGVNFLQDPDGARYEDAYREFRAAYAESPSWKMLGNLGLAAMKIERDGEAIEALKKYLAEGGSELDAEEKQQVSRDLATLTAGVVTLELSSAPAGATIADDRRPVSGPSIRNVYEALQQPTKLGVRAGHHRFVASLAGHQDEVWEVDLRPGTTVQHTFEMKPLAPTVAPAAPSAAVTSAAPAPAPAPASESSSWNSQKTMAVVAGSVGVVGLVVGTVFFTQYSSKNSEAKEICPSGMNCEPGSAARHEELVADAKSARTLTYVGWGVGVAALGGAAALYFTAPSKERSPGASLQLSPALGPGQYGAVLRGRL
jgi:hypothetical protein